VVIGVQTSEDGNHYLYLEDGRKVRLNDIDLISYPQNADSDSGDSDSADSGSGETEES
jgi:hypothetical protein